MKGKFLTGLEAENLQEYISDNNLETFEASKKPVTNVFIRAFEDGTCRNPTGLSNFRKDDLLCITDPNDIYPISQEKFNELYEEAN